MENYLTDEQFHRLKPMSNHVFVEVEFNDSIKIGGQKMFLETDFNPQDHVPVTGIVKKMPDKLYYTRDDKSESLQWETEIEVRLGDRIFFEYFASLMALAGMIDPAQEYKDPKYIIHNGKVYIFLKYDAIFFTKRNDDIIPVNGFLLCEPIKKHTKTYSIYLPDDIRNKESNKYAKIFKAGSSNKEYLEEKYMDAKEAKAGDVVLFDKFANQKVEYPLHQQFKHMGKEGSKYVAIQRRWVRAIFPPEFQEKVENGILN